MRVDPGQALGLVLPAIASDAPAIVSEPRAFCLSPGEEGIVEALVGDSRWIAPFDPDTVVSDVADTARLAGAHQASVTGVFGDEVARRVAPGALLHLAAPIEQVGVPGSRIPATPGLGLEQTLVSRAGDMAAAVRRPVAA
jgi:pyruvate/2-oxoglutarate/acetoin dehydrogenase E1 component